MPVMPKDNLDLFSDNVIKDLKELSLQSTKEFWKENGDQRRKYNTLMTRIKSRPDIVVRWSDKGGNVVLWPLQMYNLEANTQLQDKECYMRISPTHIVGIQEKYHNELYKWKGMGLINKDEFNYLKNDYPVTPQLYLIPKVHKNEKTPPGRPIISAIGSLFEKTSIFIDSFLQPEVKKLPSYIKDTGDFLSKVFDIEWQDDYLFMTLDVQSLYTSIRHQDGLKAMEYYLGKRPIELYNHTKMLLEMAEWCLTNNTFIFDRLHYKQLQGSAMGTCFSPSYANLHMGWWEEQVLKVQHSDTMQNNIVMYKRYIDDIFIIWQGNDKDAESFAVTLNENMLNLKFTCTTSNVNIQFLDLELYVQDNKIQTRTYRKPTAGNALLHAHSFHPTPLKQSIPYAECLRMTRNCSTPEGLSSAKQDLFHRLRKRGYTENTCQRAEAKCDVKNRTELIFPKSVAKDPDQEKKTPPRLITGYNRYHMNLRRILRRHWPLVRGDTSIGDTVGKNPLITFRKAKSMRNELVCNAPILKNPKNWLNSQKGFKKCSKCKACTHGINTTRVHIPFRNKPYLLREAFTCKTDFAIYVLVCSCGKRYVGSTIHPAHVRILQHLRAIANHDPAYSVARHIHKAHNGNANNIQYFVIDNIPRNIRGGNRLLALRRLESRYIILLISKVPFGLNADEALSVHL
ncbi:uncharacterized protein LOC144824087 [Lissotriton helveticus]